MSRRLSGRVVIIASVAGVLLAYAAILKHYSTQGWGRFVRASTQEGVAEIAIKREFESHSTPDEQRYDALFRYLLSGVLAFTDQPGSRIQYRGAAGVAGYGNAGLEGFARTGTLLAAWVASGREPVIVDAARAPPGDLVAYLRRGLLAGTDPKSSGYWGRIRNWDQRIVETADVARIVWM